MTSFSVAIWYPCFGSFLFLSGVFVILVYFSSMSSMAKVSVPYYFVLLSFFYFLFDCDLCVLSDLSLGKIYYDCNLSVFVWIVVLFLSFMNFVSYRLSMPVSLRSM